MKIRPMLVALTLLTVAQSIGCSDQLESTLSGTVTFEGKPVPHALLSFQYKGRGPAAYTLTDEEGSYYARTGGHVGLLPGTYQVALQPPKDVSIPKKYGNIRTSGLEYEVKQGKNTVDIEL